MSKASESLGEKFYLNSWENKIAFVWLSEWGHKVAITFYRLWTNLEIDDAKLNSNDAIVDDYLVENHVANILVYRLKRMSNKE